MDTATLALGRERKPISQCSRTRSACQFSRRWSTPDEASKNATTTHSMTGSHNSLAADIRLHAKQESIALGFRLSPFGPGSMSMLAGRIRFRHMHRSKTVAMGTSTGGERCRFAIYPIGLGAAQYYRASRAGQTLPERELRGSRFRVWPFTEGSAA